MALAGGFQDRRVELVEGEIIDMAPIGEAHAAVTDPLAEVLRAAFGPGFAVRTQAPIALGDDSKPSEPQPDIAVVVGSWRDYLTRTPGPADIRLIVEISDTTLVADQTIKFCLYASADIPEYWIVHIPDACIEVYREPGAIGYASKSTFSAGNVISPIAADKTVPVGEFLP
jgi:Uma2 family endonuclease